MIFSKLNINKLWPLLFFFGIILVLICYGLFWRNSARVSWVDTTRRKFLLYNGEIVELYQDKKLAQVFVANYPGLSQVDILFKESGVTAGNSVVVHLKRTCDAPDDIVISSTELPQIDDLAFHQFAFAPLDNSAGQTYCLILEAPKATSENAVRLQLSRGDLYPRGEARLLDLGTEREGPTPISPRADERAGQSYKTYLPIIVNASEAGGRGGDIGFRLHYTGLLWPTAQTFISRLTANKPLIWGQPWYYGVLIALYASLIVAMFYVAWKTVRLK